MLRGHETLKRTVGKRRRLISVALSPERDKSSREELSEDQASPTLGCSSSVNTTGDLSLAGKEDLWLQNVQCPLCGRMIKGGNAEVNSHIDFCLLGGNKPGKHQLTLSHFASSSAKDTNSKNTNPEQPNRSVSNRTLHLEASSSQSLATEKPICSSFYFQKNSLYWEGIEEDGNAGITRLDCEFQKHSKMACVKWDFCDCLCHIFEKKLKVDSEEMHASEGGCVTDISGNEEIFILGVIETKIVGRKFNQGAPMDKGLEVRLLREPENPKDPNAIKVVQMDESNLALGHLPRALAHHLSSLMDKRGLIHIQGFVDAVPEQASEDVPLKLICKRRSSISALDEAFLEQSWQKIQNWLEMNRNQLSSEARPASPKYQKNFLYLLQTVLERDVHLFSKEEADFLGLFASLSDDAQCLFIRLYQRKGPWFRIANTSYAEISNIEKATNELSDSGYFTNGQDFANEECPESFIKEWLELLNVPELKQLICMGPWKTKAEVGLAKREDLLDWIGTIFKEKYGNSAFGCRGSPLISMLVKTIGTCVRVSDQASFLLWRVQRMFFLNGEQDLSAFLLVNIGRVEYPTYVCRRNRNVFTTREALLNYEKALELAQSMDMAIEENNQQMALELLDKARFYLKSKTMTKVGFADKHDSPNIFLERFSATWVYSTIATLGISVLERDRRYSEAVDLLKQVLDGNCCPGRRGYWTVRLSIDLEHLGRKEESLVIAEEGLKDSRIRSGDRIALQRRVVRLGKPPRRWKKPPFANTLAKKCKEVFIRGRPLNSAKGVKSRFYGYDGNQCSVEDLALQFYAGDEGGGWNGVHSEGGVWMTLFGILMWDVLFADVPNVFFTPFQTAPLDINTDAFYPSREKLIKTQLDKIRNGEAVRILSENWVKWHGTQCRGVNWERHTLEELQIITSCVGGRGVAAICHLLAEDHAGWTGGMPDLLLWRVLPSAGGVDDSGVCSVCKCPSLIIQGNSSVQGHAKLVEVKGPRDTLSEQQRAWILILMEAGLSVEVCKILEETCD